MKRHDTEHDRMIRSLRAHPILGHLAHVTRIFLDTKLQYVSPRGWIAVSPNGDIWLNGKRKAEPAAWTRVIALALVSLGFGLVRRQEPSDLWEIACLLLADRFCEVHKLGSLPEALLYKKIHLAAGGAESLLSQFCVAECGPELRKWHASLVGERCFFFNFDAPPQLNKWQVWGGRPDWPNLLAEGIASGVGRALEVAAQTNNPGGAFKPLTRALRAKRKLMDHYPLLGALAASFDIEEDAKLCNLYGIRIAAIDVGARRIWMNPAAGLSDTECLFVFAHELLHAGLNHASRRRGRDALLWNVACDFVINGWLVEMAVGTAPVGLLHDASFAGNSTEEVYDTLAKDIRRARKLATLRGVGVQDLIGEDEGALFTDAERYCRQALAQGVDQFTHGSRRGFVPAGLIEEIRSLNQPPIAWDVKLAQWFDERFPPPEQRRSYARPSRRQSATPDFARPSVVKPSEELRRSRVFGVVLDTSGSMETRLLGKALGAIASYAMARDVAAVRLICCDAQAYDSGWVEPERLLDPFSLRGRGGTMLQPGLDLLKQLADKAEFPRAGPLLIITDGYCEDMITTAMDHAYLLPQGRHLPFRPVGQVFAVV